MIFKVSSKGGMLMLNPKTKSILRNTKGVIEPVLIGDDSADYLIVPSFVGHQVSVEGHELLMVYSVSRATDDKDYLEVYEAFGDKFGLMGFVWRETSHQAHAKSIGMIRAEWLAAATALTMRDFLWEEGESLSIGVGLSLYTVQVAFDGGYKATVHRTRLGVTEAQER